MRRFIAALATMVATTSAQTVLSGIPVAMNTTIGNGVPSSICNGPNPSLYVQLDATTGRLWACTNASGKWMWEHLLQPIPAATTVQTFTQAVQGIQGVPGESAYQIALDNGYSGSQAQWLASLIGPAGPAGSTGGETVLQYGATTTLIPGLAYNIVTLTGDTQVYAPTPSGSDAVTLTVTFCQDSVGGHQITGSNIRGMFTITPTPGKCSRQTYGYSPNQGGWLSNDSGVTNQ